MTRDDPELGPVRLCKGCGEEWPFDPEFWHMRDGKLSVSWLPRCIACCAEYYAERRRLGQLVQRSNWRSAPPAPGRCGAWMRGRQRCGRRAGHQYEHRTTVAMQVEREKKRLARAA